jgi:Raf kinase inhibitor-like YbhB/YbcL family protein
MTFVLNSPAFRDGEAIPSRYTDEGENVSPPLEWSGAPAGTRSFALIMNDQDAPGGTFYHWGVYDIMPERNLLPEGIRHGVKTEHLGHGLNGFGHFQYDGPSLDKSDPPHRYRFRLFALNVDVPFNEPKDPVADLLEAVQPHVIAEAVLNATYVSRHHS